MSIIKRPGTPFLYTEFLIEGRRIVRSTRTTSRREAEAYERKLREQVAKEVRVGSPPTPSLTIDQACGRYWRDHGRKLADARNVRRWLIYVTTYSDKTRPLHELSNKHVAELVANMERAGIGRISINRTVVCLKGVHNRAAKVWEEPVKVIDWPEHQTKEVARVRYLTRDDARRLLAALPLHIRLVVLFLLTTGLRRTEAFGLLWSKVNLKNSSATVLVKGGHEREVHLSPEAMLVLKEVPRAGERVFDVTNYRKHFEAALVTAGIENYRWHDLRHTFATWLGQSGAPLEIIRDQLGHSSIAVTQKYRHVAQQELRAALQRLPTVSPNSEDEVGHDGV